MDSVDDLTLHLPCETRHLFKKLCGIEDYRYDLRDIEEFLDQQLFLNPYPTLQILKYHSTLRNINLSDIVYHGYIKFAEHERLNTSEHLLENFLNFLANFYIDDDRVSPACDILLEVVSHLSSQKRYGCFLALLAQSKRKLLCRIGQLVSKKRSLMSKAAILYRALQCKEHIVQNLVSSDLSFLILNAPCGQALAICKLVHQLCDSQQACRYQFALSEELLLKIDAPGEASELFRVLYYDLKRVTNLLMMLKRYVRYEQPLHSVISTQSILDLIFKQTKFSSMDFEAACDFVIKNNVFYNRMQGAHMANIELYTLVAHRVLATICDIYFKTKKGLYYSKAVEERLASIKDNIRSIEDNEILVKLFKNIFTLLFLRWEDVMDGLGSDDIIDELIFDIPRDSGRCGFVCSKFLLEKLLNIVLNITVERLSNPLLDQRAQQLLANIKQAVDDATWRVNFLQENHSEVSTMKFSNFDTELMPSLFVFHAELLEQRSSDDDQVESVGVSHTLPKKKSKLKRRRSSVPNAVLENYRLLPKGLKDVNSGKSAENKGIVARMLGSPRDLAMIALSREDIEAAKEIMSKFNIKDFTLEQTISFFENVRYIKTQLEKAIARLKTYLKSQSTIEHIRKVAAIGFETSRITNIIEEFSDANRIQPDSGSIVMIEKFCSTFSFLRQYQNENLQLCIILDLILNLNMNHELSTNLWNMTNRLFGTENLLEALSKQQELYRGVGSVYFFNNIVQSMHLFKIICKENLGVKDMMCNSFFTLRSGTLKSELQKESTFKHLLKVPISDVNTVATFKKIGKSYEELKRKFNYFSRLARYISNLVKLLALMNVENAHENISLILTLNVKQTVGKILFENHIAPDDIENLAISLNLNLAHTIALNVCPTIECEASVNAVVCEFKNETICTYVSKYNPLLCFILELISGTPQNNRFMNSVYFSNARNLSGIDSFADILDGNTAVATLLFDHLCHDKLKDNSANALISIYKATRAKFERSATLSALKEEAIIELIHNDINNIGLVEDMTDTSTRIEILLENMVKIRDSEVASNLVKSLLLNDQINREASSAHQLEQFLKDIRIFSEAATDFLFETWSGAYIFAENCPELIMKELIRLKKYELCCEWWELHSETINLSLNSFHDEFLNSLLQTQHLLDTHLVKIIESFPVNDVVAFFETNIDKMKNLPVLNYVVNYLVEKNTAVAYETTDRSHKIDVNVLKYQNYRVSLNIFAYMSNDDREENWNLFSRPLLVIEQFIMNSKFEILSEILSSIRPLLGCVQSCKYCSDHMKMIYEIPTNSNITLGDPKNSAFILLNFNLYQSDHILTAACIDTLLQIYATKALDYRINEKSSTNDPASLSTEMASLDSLCGTFVMPKEAPTKDNWVKDEESIQCMCCRRANFTMLTRRHHCRRCGRVVCYSCSTNRLKISELYEDIPVRVCNDCFVQTQTLEAKTSEKISSTKESVQSKERKKANDWQLSGNLTHDKLLREEFAYEHAPSSHLCLSILSFHSNNTEYVNLLLHHCRKFEKLLKPIREGYSNPEIDYSLVAKMLNCLALAAKVRGGPPECDVVRDHSEIILSVVQNRCEGLLPTEAINNQSLRKLGDAAMLAEKWPLALDIYLKCGYSTAAVMGAYGLACLRVGRYDTAREQFFHCMTRLCKAQDVVSILKFITTEHELDVHSEIDIPTIKRSNRSPPILDQILKVIEMSSKQTHVPETFARADSIRNSNSSLASTISKSREKIPILEPAINIINTIANLKKISQGNYCDSSIRRLDNKASVMRKTQMFEESLYYLLSYGTHVDILNFLIRYDQTMCALRYFILQNLENDIFIKQIYVKHLKRGCVDYLIRQMTAIDSQLSIWKEVIIQTCRYLETKNLLNSLYHLQILLNDPIRASMTCVKFYSMNCGNFRELQNNSFHLINAQKHLQSELEMCQWENINLKKQRPVKEPSFLMQMDAKTLNCHINTILRQMEVTKFLAKAEQDEKSKRSTRQILKQIGVESSTVPTLFDSIQERIQIGILVLLCGNNIEEGFGLAYRIMQDYNLPSVKVYATTAKYLARNNRLAEVRNLINCIKSNNGTDSSEFDKILSLSVNAAIHTHLPETKAVLDDLIKMITDISTKISCHIYVGQLKSAYLLAVQNDRLNDIMKILSQAEATNQIHIVRLCEKKLNLNKR